MNGAAVAALLAAAPALAAEDLKLPRQAVELAAPPFVHPHEQATKQGPRIIEVQAADQDNKRITRYEFQAMTFNGSMPGRPRPRA